MKPLILATASALGGAAFAAALFVALPALTKDADDGSKAAATTAAPEGVVILDKAQAARASIHVVTLAPGRAAAIRHGFARALDVTSLAAIESEIVTARAAFSASQADYARQRALAGDDQSASVHAVETARAQAKADQARLTAARQRIALEYGPDLACLSDQALAHLVSAIANGSLSLIRVDFADGTPPDGTIIQIGEGAMTARVRLIGTAAVADPHLQSAGSLAIVSGALARELGTGRVLPASLRTASGSESGVLVPREALLRYQGSLWVYRLEQGGYRRVELTDARAQADGWFAPSGVKPGDRVAAGGPGVLLSIERGGAPKNEDD